MPAIRTNSQAILSLLLVFLCYLVVTSYAVQVNEQPGNEWAKLESSNILPCLFSDTKEDQDNDNCIYYIGVFQTPKRNRLAAGPVSKEATPDHINRTIRAPPKHA